MYVYTTISTRRCLVMDIQRLCLRAAARTIAGPKFVEICMHIQLEEVYTHMYTHTYQLIDSW